MKFVRKIMKTILSFVRRNAILPFALLTYLFSWWTAPFKDGHILTWGVILSAVIVLAVTEGRAGISNWKRRITHWRVEWCWYLFGPGIIVFYLSTAFILNILLGATVTHLPQLPDGRTILTLLLIGGQWEELGWSGYALPTLQRRFANQPNGAFLAALSVALIRAIWHLPLVLSGNIAWFDLVFLSLAFQLIIAWLFNRTGGSVPVVMVFHFTSNLFGSADTSVFAGQQWTDFYALFVALALLIALGILWKSGLKLGQENMQDRSAVNCQKTA
jgi:uncharacterized protein